MAEQFYTILTNIGKAKIANAGALGIKVDLSTLVLGDGNGSYYNPVETQIKLVNEVYRRNINNVSVDSENPNWIVIETVVPSAEGGFTIREVGCLDTAGDLIVVGKYPETYKPKVEDGAVKDLTVKIIMEVSNAENVTIKVDPSVILATKKDLEEATKPVSKTYEELKQMIQDKKLIQGRKYLLTDYRTKYQQPTTLVIKEMAIEQLVLTANSTNSFEPIVSSPTYPQDIIQYNFNDNVCEDKTTPRTGFIQRRTDTITKNDCPQDWRTMLWARYKPDATQYYKDGVLNPIVGWMGGRGELGRLYYANNSFYMAKNTDIATSGTDPNVFYQVYEDINVGMLIEEKTKIGDKVELKKGELHERLTFGTNCYRNFIGEIQSPIHNNVFGDDCASNTLENACYINTFGNNFFTNHLGNDCSRNIIMNNCTGNSFDVYCSLNVIGRNCASNSFGSNFDKNILGYSCINNSFGNNCDENILTGNCNHNSFGNRCYGNTLAYNCTSNSFGNECYGNVLGNTCARNSFLNYCNENKIGDNCRDNSFGNYCGNNNIGRNFTRNYLGNVCYNNTFGETCSSNVLLVDNYSNTFSDNLHGIMCKPKTLVSKNLTSLSIYAQSRAQTFETNKSGSPIYWFINDSNQIEVTKIP